MQSNPWTSTMSPVFDAIESLNQYHVACVWCNRIRESIPCRLCLMQCHGNAMALPWHCHGIARYKFGCSHLNADCRCFPKHTFPESWTCNFSNWSESLRFGQIFSGFVTTGTWYHVPGTRYQVPGTRYKFGCSHLQRWLSFFFKNALFQNFKHVSYQNGPNLYFFSEITQM